MTTPLVSVITPVRPHERMGAMVDSLMAQSCQDFELIAVVDKDSRGQSWARNRGAEMARGQFLLFSDSDINWAPQALETLLSPFDSCRDQDVVRGGMKGLHFIECGYDKAVEQSYTYSYGGYHLCQGERVIDTLCAESFVWEHMLAHNIVSTMALVPRKLFLDYRFDEKLHRLEDWDLWLRMGLDHKYGYYVGQVLFTTQKRHGITFGGQHDHASNEAYIRVKLGL